VRAPQNVHRLRDDLSVGQVVDDIELVGAQNTPAKMDDPDPCAYCTETTNGIAATRRASSGRPKAGVAQGNR